jgi:hypothetical protein
MENIQDSVRDLRHTFGARNGMSTLTETTALYALALRTLGWSYQRIATHLGVGHGAVEKVCTGQRWRHLRIPPDLRTTILQKALSQGPSTCILFK